MPYNLSLVLPCYNEEKNISILCEEFLKLPFQDIQAELILVNNGSEDQTLKEIKEAIKNNTSKNVTIKLVNLEKNKGYGGGITEGLKKASGEYIGWAHADLQTPLTDFLKLYKLIKNKNNVLGKGYRVNTRGFDGIISRLHERLASIILGFKMEEINAQPKIFNRKIMRYFNNMPYKWTTLDTYVMYTCLKNKIEIETTDVIFNTRKYGQSKWKNNFINFFSHIIFNVLYLFKLRFTKN